MWRSFTWENLSVCNAHLWQLPISQITVPNTTNTRNHTYHVVGNLLLPFCLKSNLMACHTVWLPIIMGSASALSKIKKLRRKVNHSALSGAPTGAAFLEKSLHYEAKSSVVWDVQSYGASSQEGLPWTDFSWPQRKILRPINIVFENIWPEWPWIALFTDDFWQLQLTRHWSISVHVSCVMLSHDLWRNKLKEFPNSPEVLLFLKPESFFQSFLLSIAGC